MFAVRKFAPYGALSGKNVDELIAGERVAVDAEQARSAGFRAVEDGQA